VVFAMLARTFALSSLAVARFTLIGASQTDVWIVNPDHPDSVKKIENVNILHTTARTFTEIPSEFPAVIDNAGMVRGALKDFKAGVVLGYMLIGGALCLVGIFGLEQLWLVPGRLLAEWRLFFLSAVFLIVLTLLIWGTHLLFVIKAEKSFVSHQGSLVSASEKVVPGQTIIGSVEKKFIDESYEARFNKLIQVSKIVVRIPELFPYPIFIECAFDPKKSAQEMFSALTEGMPVSLVVKDDYSVTCKY